MPSLQTIRRSVSFLVYTTHLTRIVANTLFIYFTSNLREYPLPWRKFDILTRFQPFRVCLNGTLPVVHAIAQIVQRTESFS